MNFNLFAKIAGVVAMTAALAGCIDVTMDVQVQNEKFVPIFNGEPFCAKNIFENGKERKLKPAEIAKG